MKPGAPHHAGPGDIAIFDIAFLVLGLLGIAADVDRRMAVLCTAPLAGPGCIDPAESGPHTSQLILSIFITLVVLYRMLASVRSEWRRKASTKPAASAERPGAASIGLLILGFGLFTIDYFLHLWLTGQCVPGRGGTGCIGSGHSQHVIGLIEGGIIVMVALGVLTPHAWRLWRRLRLKSAPEAEPSGE